MNTNSHGAVELLHFVFLERLLRISDAKLYVLKGGVNLRFHFGSPRYSEDMDLDVNPIVAVSTLKKNGYKILHDAALLRVLKTHGIAGLEVNAIEKAKHTETTQRFRLRLETSAGQHIPTKIEFSRRGLQDGAVTESIPHEVARRIGRNAFFCGHYDAHTAMKQKIHALAGRTQTQARDLFDLYWLDSHADFLKAVNAFREESNDASIELAASNLAAITFEQFQGQVVEFLHDEYRTEFDDKTRFNALHAHILDGLLSAEGRC